MSKPNTLLCTIGVSLFYPNLSNLAKETQTDPILCSLSEAYADAVQEQQRKIDMKSARRVPYSRMGRKWGAYYMIWTQLIGSAARKLIL